MRRTRSSLSAAHSFSVNFSVRAFWGSSSASAGARSVGAGSVVFVSGSELAGMGMDIVMEANKDVKRRGRPRLSD
jgi:hypothetical protein